MVNCVNHPEIEAAGICKECGRPFCNHCLTFVGGKNYCSQCLSNVINSKNQPQQPAYIDARVFQNQQQQQQQQQQQDGDFWLGVGVCCVLLIIVIIIASAMH